MAVANETVAARFVPTFSRSSGTSRQLQQQQVPACPAGTVAAYNDETLGFRFRTDGIAIGSDGKLVWNAEVPTGLAFIAERPDDPVADDVPGATNPYSGRNITLPTIIVPPYVPPGVQFESGQEAPGNQMMVSNLKLAIGSQHTLFSVVTPSAAAEIADTLLGFRPFKARGGHGWLMATVECLNTGPGETNEHASGCMGSNDWGNGFVGPAFQGGVTQIAIWRSRLTFNSLVSRRRF